MAVLKRITRKKARCGVCGGPLERGQVKACTACLKKHFWGCGGCFELIPNSERDTHACPGRSLDIMDLPDDLPF